MDATSLRSEIVEAQKSTVDLEKWKLILVAALGAAGLGLLRNVEQPGWVVALIPLVCLYVDVLVYHNVLRIHVIAKFLREQDRDPICKEYEIMCRRHRDSFPLEQWATVVISVAASLGVAFAAPLGLVRGRVSFWVLLVAGILGIAASVMAYVVYTQRLHKLE